MLKKTFIVLVWFSGFKTSLEIFKVYPVSGESNSISGEDFPSSGEGFHFELWSCGL